MKKDEFIEKYGIEAYEKQLEQNRNYHKKYYQENSEKIKESACKWNKDNKEKHNEHNRKYREENPEKLKEYRRKWKEEHPEYFKEYYKTPMGRAVYLVKDYKDADKKYNRGECTITAKWIVEHIFTSQCVYCGETDWRKLGCDRIDNSLPHTPDNVVCACWDCNNERKTKPFEEFKLRKTR